MKVLVCCGSGFGSSYMMEENIRKALNEIGASGITIEHCELAKAGEVQADLYVGTRDIACELEKLGKPVISLNNILAISELKRKLQETLTSLGKL